MLRVCAAAAPVWFLSVTPLHVGCTTESNDKQLESCLASLAAATQQHLEREQNLIRDKEALIQQLATIQVRRCPIVV